MYSEQELKHAAEFRNEIHKAALKKVRDVFPDAVSVVDQYPVEAYFQEVWDYPGQWYMYFKLPGGFERKTELILAIAEETIDYFSKKK